MLRRLCLVLGLLLCLGAVGCDEKDRTVVLERAGDTVSGVGQASGSPVLALVGAGIAAIPGLLGWAGARKAKAFTESPWDRAQLGELIDDLEKHPDQAARLRKLLQEPPKP